MNERYTSKHHKRIEMSGFSIAAIGSLLLIIGYCIPYLNFPNRAGDHPGYTLLLSFSYIYSDDFYQRFLDVVALFILMIIACMFIFSVLALNGYFKQRVNIFTNSTFVMIILSIFLFLPFLSPYYAPMISNILTNITLAASSVARSSLATASYEHRAEYGPGFYLLAIGVILLITSYPILLYSSYKRWNNSFMKKKKVNAPSPTLSPNKRILETVISSLGIFSSVGLIIGLTTPLYYWVFRTVPTEEPLEGYIFGTRTYLEEFAYYVRFDTMFYLMIVISLLTFFILQLISYYKSHNMRNYKPLIFFLMIMLMMIPSSNPDAEGYIFRVGVAYFLRDIYSLFSSAAYIQIAYDNNMADAKYFLSPTVWIMVISLIILFLILIYYFINFLQTKIEKRFKVLNE